MPLPFDRGYHTPDFTGVSDASLRTTGASSCGRPACRSTRASAGLFPRTSAGVRKLAAAQWSQKVRFRETIEQMVADGVGCFVEVASFGQPHRIRQRHPAGKAQVSIASNCAAATASSNC
jgi:hypothetical protein